MTRHSRLPIFQLLILILLQILYNKTTKATTCIEKLYAHATILLYRIVHDTTMNSTTSYYLKIAKEDKIKLTHNLPIQAACNKSSLLKPPKEANLTKTQY